LGADQGGSTKKQKQEDFFHNKIDMNKYIQLITL
jgi:hypothetical protein